MGEREISHCRDLHPTSHVQLVRLHDKVLLGESLFPYFDYTHNLHAAGGTSTGYPARPTMTGTNA
jgi:hypothetical protein